MNKKLSVAIITRDRPEELARSIAHHLAVLKQHDMQLYVFDNSIKTNNSALIAKYPEVIYHKHGKDLSYDESFRYALEHLETDYRWVISDRVFITIGAISYIFEHFELTKPSAFVVGMGNRLVLMGETTIQKRPEDVLVKVGWHTTLCSSVIYNAEMLGMVDIDKYMGHDFIHTAIFLDGITKLKLPVVIIPASFLLTKDMYPAWLFQHIRIWTKDLFDMAMKLPYQTKHIIQFLQAGGTGGKVMSEEALKYLIIVGALTHEILDEYAEYLKVISLIPIEKIHGWIDSVPKCGE